MSTTPRLPEPFAYPEGTIPHACVCGSWPGGECLRCTVVSFYTADQMHAYGLAVWKAAMETAAQMCEAQDGGPVVVAVAKGCAVAVRSISLPAGSPQERREG